MTRGGGFTPDDDSKRPFDELLHPIDPDATGVVSADPTLTQSLGNELFVEMSKPGNEAGPISNDGVAEYIEGKTGDPKSQMEHRMTAITGVIFIIAMLMVLVGVGLRILAWGLKPWIG